MTARLFASAAALTLLLSATAQAELSSTPPASKPAPRVIESTGSYVADAQPVPAPRVAPQTAADPRAETTGSVPPAAQQRPVEASRPAVSERPARVRTARYTGGEGSTWKTGRDAYGFMGTYGGCRYSDHAGPRGYTLDRVCR